MYNTKEKNKKILSKELEKIAQRITQILSDFQLDENKVDKFKKLISKYKELKIKKVIKYKRKDNKFQKPLRNLFYLLSIVSFKIYINKNSRFKRSRKNSNLLNLDFNPLSRAKLVDYGGIFEKYLCTSMNNYPPQVGRDIYTTSIALVLFDYFKLFNNLDKAIYYIKNRESENRRLEFNHVEFENFFYSLSDNNFIKNFLKSNLESTNYQPNNVIAMRMATFRKDILNKPFLHFLFINSSKILMRISQNSTGIIEDSTLSKRKKSLDTTYTWYSAACLVIYNIDNNDEFVDRILFKKCCSIMNLQSSSGSISFSGRAANSSYHEASAILLMAYGINRYNLNLIENLELSFNRLNKYLTEEGIPTSLSLDPFDYLSGWHGSSLQYSALTAIFLTKASEILTNKKITSLNKKVLHKFNFNNFKKSKIKRAKLSNSSVIVSCKGYLEDWQSGLFTTGYGGISSIAINKIEVISTLFKYNEVGKEAFFGISDLEDINNVKLSENNILCFKNYKLVAKISFLNPYEICFHFYKQYLTASELAIRSDCCDGKLELYYLGDNCAKLKSNNGRIIEFQNIYNFKLGSELVETPSGFSIPVQFKLKNKFKLLFRNF